MSVNACILFFCAAKMLNYNSKLLPSKNFQADIVHRLVNTREKKIERPLLDEHTPVYDVRADGSDQRCKKYKSQLYISTIGKVQCLVLSEQR